MVLIFSQIALQSKNTQTFIILKHVCSNTLTCIQDSGGVRASILEQNEIPLYRESFPRYPGLETGPDNLKTKRNNPVFVYCNNKIQQDV